MSIDNRFLIKKITQMDQIIAAFCSFTHMPFLYCDPVSFADQVWIFPDEEGLRTFAERFAGQKIQLQGVVIKKNAYMGFFGSLLPIGVTEVVFTDNGASAAIPLDQFVTRKDLSGIPAASRPLENPNLQLTGIYLMQEARRPVPNEEKESLAELNEEFLVNLARARFLMPITLKKGSGSVAEKMGKGEFSFVNLTMKNKDVYRPIFADMLEFNKFKQNRDFRALTLSFGALKSVLPKEAKGFLMNPNGCQIVLAPQLIDQVLARFPDEVKAGAEETRKIQESAAGPLAKKPAPSLQQMQGHSKVTMMPGQKPEKE